MEYIICFCIIEKGADSQSNLWRFIAKVYIWKRFLGIMYTQKNLNKSNLNKIVLTIFLMIWNQTVAMDLLKLF